MPDFIKQIYWTICYYSFLLMFMTGTILLNLLSLLIIPFIAETKARCILRKAVYHLFSLYLCMMEASGALVTNRDLLKRLDEARGGLLIIANHPSLLDAPIIFSRIHGLMCVFKSSLNKSLGISRTARAIGYLSNDGGLDMIRDLSTALAAGEKVLLFPEGTRTTSDTIDPFNPGYALAAIRAQVPVQILKVHSDSPILSKKQSKFSTTRFPCTFLIEIGPTIEPGEFKTVKSLNAFVAEWYRTASGATAATAIRFLPVARSCSGDEDTITTTFLVPADPFYCRGHMPGHPIVPAYAQMAWVREIVNAAYPAVSQGLNYFRWKFLQPIVPGDRITIRINFKNGKNQVVIMCQDQRVTHGLLEMERTGA